MQTILVYNWKTYLTDEEQARMLAEGLTQPNKIVTVVCPSALHISAVHDVLKRNTIVLGAQDISVSRETPQTGNLSGDQLTAVGARYVIVGHAETRASGVTDTMVTSKANHALQVGITPIICLSEQQTGTQDEVVAQLKAILKEIATPERIVIAYEPTAHIGIDQALDTSAIYTVAEQLRAVAFSEVPILYGGSVNPENAKDILQNGGVDGFLLGRASIQAKTANTIADIAEALC